MFDTSRVQVWVDNVKEFDISAGATPFSTGMFGFYNYSQSHVRYDAVNQVSVVPLPPAAWLGLAMMGGLGIVGRRRRKEQTQS